MKRQREKTDQENAPVVVKHLRDVAPSRAAVAPIVLAPAAPPAAMQALPLAELAPMRVAAVVPVVRAALPEKPPTPSEKFLREVREDDIKMLMSGLFRLGLSGGRGGASCRSGASSRVAECSSPRTKSPTMEDAEGSPASPVAFRA